MKKFKKIIVILSVIMLLTAAFSSCIKPQEGLKTVEITIGETSHILETNENYLHGALLELKNKGAIATYEISGSEDSIYIVEIEGITFDPQLGYGFIAIYHNIDDIILIDTSGYIDDITLNGVTFKASGVGVAMLPLYDNAKYLLVDLYC